MTKKKQAAKKKTTTKKTTTKARANRDKSPDDILAIWEDALTTGATGKEFDPEIANFYTQLLLDRIAKVLAGHDGQPPQQFDSKAEKATKRTAHDIGAICKMLTLGKKVVSKDTFDAVFNFVGQSHPACAGAGGGEWCDIGG
jgi:hypothetical protein